jgi:hypothetical protein
MITFWLISTSALHPIPPLGTFEKWGINLMRPLLATPRANKLLVVATYYLTKWANNTFKNIQEARSGKVCLQEDCDTFWDTFPYDFK